MIQFLILYIAYLSLGFLAFKLLDHIYYSRKYDELIRPTFINLFVKTHKEREQELHNMLEKMVERMASK